MSTMDEVITEVKVEVDQDSSEVVVVGQSNAIPNFKSNFKTEPDVVQVPSDCEEEPLIPNKRTRSTSQSPSNSECSPDCTNENRRELASPPLGNEIGHEAPDQLATGKNSNRKRKRHVSPEHVGSSSSNQSAHTFRDESSTDPFNSIGDSVKDTVNQIFSRVSGDEIENEEKEQVLISCFTGILQTGDLISRVDVSKKEKIIKNQEGEISKLQGQLEACKSSYEDLEAEMKNVEEELRDSRDNCKFLKEQVTAQEKQIGGLRISLVEQQELIKRLNASIMENQMSTNELKDTLKKCEESRDSFKKQAIDGSTKFANQAIELKALKVQVADKSCLLQISERERTILKEKLTANEKSSALLLSSCNEKNEVIEELTSKFENEQKLSQQIMTDLKQCAQNLHKEKLAGTRKATQIEKHILELQYLKDTLTAKEENLNKLNAETFSLKSKLNKENNLKLWLEKQIESMKMDSELKKELHAKEVESYESRIKEYQEKEKHYEVQLEELNNKLASEEEEMKAMKLKIYACLESPNAEKQRKLSHGEGESNNTASEENDSNNCNNDLVEAPSSEESALSRAIQNRPNCDADHTNIPNVSVPQVACTNMGVPDNRTAGIEFVSAVLEPAPPQPMAAKGGLLNYQLRRTHPFYCQSCGAQFPKVEHLDEHLEICMRSKNP